MPRPFGRPHCSDDVIKRLLSAAFAVAFFSDCHHFNAAECQPCASSIQFMAHLFRSDRADSVALDSSRCHSDVSERSPKEIQNDYTISVHVNNGGKVETIWNIA